MATKEKWVDEDGEEREEEKDRKKRNLEMDIF